MIRLTLPNPNLISSLLPALTLFNLDTLSSKASLKEYGINFVRVNLLCLDNNSKSFKVGIVAPPFNFCIFETRGATVVILEICCGHKLVSVTNSLDNVKSSGANSSICLLDKSWPYLALTYIGIKSLFLANTPKKPSLLHFSKGLFISCFTVILSPIFLPFKELTETNSFLPSDNSVIIVSDIPLISSKESKSS